MKEIPLRNRAGETVAVTVMDDADYERVKEMRWSRNAQGYAQHSVQKNGVRSTFHMHRHLLGLQPGDGAHVDHINGDKLDNRRANLRYGAEIVNRQNLAARTDGTSRHRGVFWASREKRWVARAMVNRRSYHLGTFKNEIDAAVAYDEFCTHHMPGYVPERSALRQAA